MPTPQEGPAGFWPDFVAKAQPGLPGRAKGIITVNGMVTHTLEGDLLTLIAPGLFEKNQIDKPAVLEVCASAASGLLGRPIRVRVSLKGKQAFSGGEKSFDALMDFGKQHSDIIKFTKQQIGE